MLQVRRGRARKGTCGGVYLQVIVDKQEHIVLERSARLNLDPQDLKKKCFQGEDDVCWRKIIN